MPAIQPNNIYLMGCCEAMRLVPDESPAHIEHCYASAPLLHGIIVF